jgi:hypothetical protein
MQIRRATAVIEDVFSEAGRGDGAPLRRVAVLTAIRNPMGGMFRDDLTPLMDFGAPLATRMAQMLLDHFDANAELIESYGKAVIVGPTGELEHGHALVTRPFGSAVRRALSASAWMCCNVKRGAIGSAIDVPLAYKNALAVRSHYDTMQVGMADAPLDNELVVVLAAASRGRLHARTGGLRKEEVTGCDVYVDKV